MSRYILSTLKTNIAAKFGTDNKWTGQEVEDSYIDSIDSLDLGFYNVKNYGAVGDGVTNDTAAIQAAVTAAETALGGCIFFPAGAYLVTATISATTAPDYLYFLGQGECSRIDMSGDYGDVINLVPSVARTNTNPVYGVRFANLWFNPTSNRTSGYVINTSYTHKMSLFDVRIGTLQWSSTGFPVYAYNGVNFNLQGAGLVSSCQINTRNYGLRFHGDWARYTGQLGHGFWNGLVTNGTEIWGDRNSGSFRTGSVGILLEGSTGGFQFEQGNISFYDNAIYANGDHREIFLNNAFMGDDCGGSGIRIASKFNILTIDNVWVAGSGRGAQTPSAGIYVDDACTTFWNPTGVTDPRIVITGGTVYANDNDGIYLGTGIITMSNVQTYSNGGDDLVLGTNVKKCAINGGWIKDGAIVNNSSPAITPKLRGILDVTDAG